jgi:mono/diheme cytochrome c family protein
VILQQALSLGESASPKKHDAMSKLAEIHGQQRFIADAIASGLAGEEEEFVRKLVHRESAENATPVIAACVAAVIQSGNATRITSVLNYLAESTTPSWAKTAIFEGVDKFIPRRADRERVAGRLPAAPSALLLLAEQVGTHEGKRAAELLQYLRWPGKPGEPEQASKLGAAQGKLFEHGRAQYAALCASCHQPEGQGLAGLAPALVNSRWVLGSPELAASIVLCGKMDDGKIMPALKGVLDDVAIADVLTFIRNSWGHSATPVDAQTVAKVRADTAERTEPFTEAELVELEGKR